MSDASENITNINIERVSVTNCSLCGCIIDVTDLDPFLKIECPDCGNVETVPGKLGQFLLLELLGSGGMGCVYRAKDMVLGRLVALKVMLQSVSEDKAFIETFKREAQSSAKINHPHIAQIYSFGQERGQYFIVMELVSGKHFDKMIDKKKPISQAIIMQVGIDIAEGLQVADEVGLIHGDIKPENILLDERMNAKLIDFGIATFSKQGGNEGIWGTPYYIAPEKIKRQKIDARSDIYSLGATLYHALAARPPFEGETPIEVVKARLEKPPEPIRTYREDINPKVEGIIRRMLQIDPSRRYPNYASLISDFQSALADLGGALSQTRNIVTGKGRRVIMPKQAFQERQAPVTSDSKRRPSIKLRKSSSIEEPSGPRSAIEKYKEQAKEAVEPEKKSGSAGKVFLILLLLALAGGGVMTGVHIKEKKEKERLMMIEREALKKSAAQAGVVYTSIQMLASNVLAISESAGALSAKTADAVFAVLGETLEAHAIPAAPAPQEEPKQDGQTAKDDAPPPGAAAPVTPAVLEQKDLAQAEVQADEPEIKTIGRNVMTIAAKIQSYSANAQSIQATAFPVKIEAERANTSALSIEKVTALQKDLTIITDVESKAKESFVELENHAGKVDAIKTNIQKEKETSQKAQEDEEAGRRAKEDAQRRAEERAALVKSELALAETARNINDVLVKQNKFKEARDTLKAQLSDYRTEEGKAALSIQIERYDRMHNLLLFLIEQINSDPFPWGYGRGATARDILSANEKGITIKGGDRPIPWETMDIPQMMSFFKRYLTSKKARIRALGEANLAAAIFCHETARGSENALRVSKTFARQAVDYCSDLDVEVRKLLPFE